MTMPKHTTEGLRLAKLFHDTYERLAPEFGYETRPDTKEFDPESKNGKLMIAVCSEVVTAQQLALLDKVDGLIDEHDPSQGSASKAYWGNTLRQAMTALRSEIKEGTE